MVRVVLGVLVFTAVLAPFRASAALDLAAIAPNSSGPYQQAGPRAESGFGNTHQGSRNANSRRSANQDYDYPRRQNRYSAARGQGLGHPIDMNGLSRCQQFGHRRSEKSADPRTKLRSPHIKSVEHHSHGPVLL